MTKWKTCIDLVFGVAGSVAGFIFGPCDAVFVALLVLMCVDLILGFTTGIVGVSKHSTSGTLNSKTMWVGIAKKVGELAMVVVGVMLDYATGLGVVRMGVCMALIAQETLSITENATLLGVIDIPIINQALDVITEKGGTKQ